MVSDILFTHLESILQLCLCHTEIPLLFVTLTDLKHQPMKLLLPVEGRHMTISGPSFKYLLLDKSLIQKGTNV